MTKLAWPNVARGTAYSVSEMAGAGTSKLLLEYLRSINHSTYSSNETKAPGLGTRGPGLYEWPRGIGWIPHLRGAALA